MIVSQLESFIKNSQSEIWFKEYPNMEDVFCPKKYYFGTLKKMVNLYSILNIRGIFKQTQQPITEGC